VSINKYIPRSLQNIKDRLEAYNESITKELFSTELPKTFEVIIYTQQFQDTRTPPTLPANQTSGDTSAYHFYKARSLAGHHDHLSRPESAENIGSYERLRNAHFQAVIEKSSQAAELPQLGDVWLATEIGADLVSLDTFKRKENIILRLSSTGTAQSAYSNGNQPATSARSYSSTPVPLPTAVPTPIPNRQGYTNNATPGDGIIPNNDATQQILLKFISEGEGSYNASNNGTAYSKSKTGQKRGIINSISQNSYVSLKTGLVTDSKITPEQKLLSELTVGEIMGLQGWKPNDQELLNYTHDNPNRNHLGRNNRVLFAVGRYQIIPRTMYSTTKALKIDFNTVFDKDTQDYMGLYLLYKKPSRRAMSNYLLGRSNNITAAVRSFAMEWASGPDPNPSPEKLAAAYPKGIPSSPLDYKVSYYGNGNKAHHTVREVQEVFKKVRKLNIDNPPI